MGDQVQGVYYSEIKIRMIVFPFACMISVEAGPASFVFAVLVMLISIQVSGLSKVIEYLLFLLENIRFSSVCWCAFAGNIFKLMSG